jgi:hypothetical protein
VLADFNKDRENSVSLLIERIQNSCSESRKGVASLLEQVSNMVESENFDANKMRSAIEEVLNTLDGELVDIFFKFIRNNAEADFSEELLACMALVVAEECRS